MQMSWRKPPGSWKISFSGREEQRRAEEKQAEQQRLLSQHAKAYTMPDMDEAEEAPKWKQKRKSSPWHPREEVKPAPVAENKPAPAKPGETPAAAQPRGADRTKPASGTARPASQPSQAPRRSAPRSPRRLQRPPRQRPLRSPRRLQRPPAARPASQPAQASATCCGTPGSSARAPGRAGIHPAHPAPHATARLPACRTAAAATQGAQPAHFNCAVRQWRPTRASRSRAHPPAARPAANLQGPYGKSRKSAGPTAVRRNPQGPVWTARKNPAGSLMPPGEPRRSARRTAGAARRQILRVLIASRQPAGSLWPSRKSAGPLWPAGEPAGPVWPSRRQSGADPVPWVAGLATAPAVRAPRWADASPR